MQKDLAFMYSITVPEVYLCLYNEENGIWIHKMKKGASNKMKGYREALLLPEPGSGSGLYEQTSKDFI